MELKHQGKHHRHFARQTLNRTIMELKPHYSIDSGGQYIDSQSHHYGIETQFAIFMLSGAMALNRTIMELKQKIERWNERYYKLSIAPLWN